MGNDVQLNIHVSETVESYFEDTIRTDHSV